MIGQHHIGKSTLRHYGAGRCRFLAAAAFVCLLSACGGKGFVVKPFEPGPLLERAIVQSEDDATVSAAIPDPQETEVIFGLPLYDQGIQPVWLQIENLGSERLRYAPVGTDRTYFSPLEVAYKNRSGYSKEARAVMDRQFYDFAIPRYVDPGETISGFLLTHTQPGTKGFNVDLFGRESSLSFTFFIAVPGFVPDHAEVDFQNIYTADEAVSLDEAGLYNALASAPCCTTDEAGLEKGSPLNVVVAGDGQEVLYALLRAHWREMAAGEQTTALGSENYYYDARRQDAIFRYEGKNKAEGYYELRLWLSPMQIDENPVWLGQLRHFLNHRWTTPRPDPDIDGAQTFLLQNLWYSGTLLKYGWIPGDRAVPFEAAETDFQGSKYFTADSRLLVWISADPVSLVDVNYVYWDRSGATHE